MGRGVQPGSLLEEAAGIECSGNRLGNGEATTGGHRRDIDTNNAVPDGHRHGRAAGWRRISRNIDGTVPATEHELHGIEIVLEGQTDIGSGDYQGEGTTEVGDKDIRSIKTTGS